MNDFVEAVDTLGGTEGFGAGDAFVPVRTEELENTAGTLPQPPEGSTVISLEDFVGTVKGEIPATPVAKEEPKAPAPEAVELQMDTLVRDPADGQLKPFSQINGERALKPEYDRVMRGRALVDQNLPFLEAVDKSTAGKVLATALAAGASEQDALAAAAAAIGVSIGGKAEVKEPEDPQPVRPVMPAGAEPGSPEHSEWFLADLNYKNELTAWSSRQEIKKMAASYEKKIDDLRKEMAAEKQMDSEYTAVQQHNNALYQQNILRYVPNFAQLDPAMRGQIIKTVDDAFVSNGIDAKKFQEEKLSGAEVKGVFVDVADALKAFAPKQQPPVNGNPKAPPLAPSAPTAGMRPMNNPWSQQDPYLAYRGLDPVNQ